MILHNCKESVEFLLGRSLSEEELEIVKFLCSIGSHDLEIADAICNFLVGLYFAKLEKLLGRKLTTEERKMAKELFRKGVSIKDAVKKMNEDKEPTSQSGRRPKP